MSKSKYILSSVSATALVAGGAQGVLAGAHELSDPGYTLTVKGGALFLDNPHYEKIDSYSGAYTPIGSGAAEEKFGAPGGDMSYFSSVSLERQAGDSRDVTFEYFNGLEQENARGFSFEDSFGGPFSGSGVNFSMNNYLGFQGMNVEVGHRTDVGAAGLRTFYGAQVLQTNSQNDKVGEYYYYSGVDPRFESGGAFNLATQSQFTGVGPRVGLGYSSNVGQLGLSAEVGGAALFGSINHSAYVCAGDYFETDGDRVCEGQSGGDKVGSQTAMAMDADVAINMQVGSAGALSVGYKAYQFWNIDLWSDEETDGPPWTGPRLAHGPYVGYSTNF